MTSLTELFTVEEVAQRFGVTPAAVKRACSRPIKPWPHLRPTKNADTWRFTTTDVADIEALIRRNGLSGGTAWGQTGRSAARAGA